MSRAYYVSFARLIGVCTPLGFQQSMKDAKSGVHARLREFLWVSHVPVLKTIGRSRLGTLYELRIRADYRFSVPITKIHALEAVQLAEDIDDWLTDAAL